MRRLTSQALPGIMLVIVVLWALTAVIFLTGILAAANRIESRVGVINSSLSPINGKLNTVPILANVSDTANQIRDAAAHLSPTIGRIADSATDGDTVRISPALIQPMAADDVATAVARTAVGRPVGRILEVGGPDRYPLDDLVRAWLRAQSDTRRVITDAQARYFGVVLDDHTLVPDTTATVLPTRFQDWLVDNAPAPVR